jgi:hypothetical protein
MKIKKVIKTMLVVLLVLILAVVVLFKLFGTGAIKTGIEVAGTQTLKVPVTVGDVSLSLLAGKAGIDDLVIANPAGYANATMIQMGKIRVDLAVSSLISDTVRIENILLDKVSVTLEQKGLTNNIQQILKGMDKTEKETTKVTKTKSEPGQKNLVNTHLELTNINVKVKLLPVPGKSDTLTLKLSPIIMENLGSQSKMDIAILTDKILVAIVTGIAQQGAGKLPDSITGPLGDAAKSFGAASEKLLKKTEKLFEGGSQDLGKEIEDIGKGIGDLFKKKDSKKD